MNSQQRVWNNALEHISEAEKRLSAVKHDMAKLSYTWASTCRTDLRGAIKELQFAIEAMAQVEAIGWKD